METALTIVSAVSALMAPGMSGNFALIARYRLGCRNCEQKSHRRHVGAEKLFIQSEVQYCPNYLTETVAWFIEIDIRML
jgi:hypothetical protein